MTNLLFSRLILMFRNDSGLLFSISDARAMFLCWLLRCFLNVSTCSFDGKNKTLPSTYLLFTTGLNCVGQFSKQIFSKWRMKLLANVGSSGKTHCRTITLFIILLIEDEK